MPPIEIGSLRPLKAIESRLARQAGGEANASRAVAGGGNEPGTVARSDMLSAGNPPVDSDRVAAIRKAIETGTYPVIPAKVADAIIAAGYLLRSGK
ncbi:hypothetical protein GCM10011371_30330 [Novosphingobium marinum]|uniref:Negative regulator of flagellin synthesis FlgM n=1 Tax=Novosphingobium marinum TaxID=1514948 RepID=A0A7Z0BTB3_9SPHN|nr:flagellar biosynthesis anti-sigma factor FlgM [Novosphingobium marinum]NYH95014.1 negative regulator of flagellin synthesis FlgM [Novosphingobium marinum]GGC40847.1 hypothetical protein GCM10011371_30330 [Novosphingobium marinum]